MIWSHIVWSLLTCWSRSLSQWSSCSLWTARFGPIFDLALALPWGSRFSQGSLSFKPQSTLCRGTFLDHPIYSSAPPPVCVLVLFMAHTTNLILSLLPGLCPPYPQPCHHRMYGQEVLIMFILLTAVSLSGMCRRCSIRKNKGKLTLLVSCLSCLIICHHSSLCYESHIVSL